MQVQARVHNGEYGGKSVNDLVFPLVKGFNVGKNGGFITVDGAHVPGFPDREIRIKLISKNDYEVINSFQAQVEENSKEETVKTPYDPLENCSKQPFEEHRSYLKEAHDINPKEHCSTCHR